ncbi:hypothetical protein A4H02_09170 [Fervidobacterium thailandense]|uniref:DUF2225 domain-containing protein n=2 Tax=Fervidobacterium thailandense TaxID=1008305 RepID=A0A1E3G0H0_9BACT|nr:hypothetical protein A4H02_09170 [Fervidobacterium thailandense]
MRTVMPETWDKKYTCPLCGSQVTSKKVFTEKIVIKSYDEDLKPNYEGVNPLLYAVVVCNSCHHAALENDFEKYISPIHLEELRNVLGTVKIPEGVDFSKARDHKTALLAHALAALCYRAKKQLCKVAEMYLRMGWLHRELKDTEAESKALAKALVSFEECYMSSYIEEEKEPMVLFYLAELSRRFGKKEEALRWFSTLVTKYKNSNSFYVKVGKERWQDLK